MCCFKLTVFLYYYSINKFVFFIKVTFVILMIIILFSYLYYNGFYIVERFLQSGDVTEAGSSGRLNMWRWIMPAIVNNPFGYGIGNAVESVKFISGDDRFMDNNIHLYPMQVLLDFGILGFSFYLFALFYFIKKIFSVRGESLIYYSFIMIYFILGAVQFKGGETLIYLVAGFALSIERAES
ncbi:O-antigen ligase family protein [Pectobacterium parmentieri]|uniref:O-antigen ligase family protein n=1 Tax=Pectobacterium parmentieri TaxID=1905730 RepID=UPI0018DEFCD7|nr:O-antigen ligase family protein [Pectobacterium parmentieri]